jgi:hypothetical protein
MSDIDKQIELLKKGELISEEEVIKLCSKVTIPFYLIVKRSG